VHHDSNGMGVFSYGANKDIERCRMIDYLISEISTMSDDAVDLLLKKIKES